MGSTGGEQKEGRWSPGLELSSERPEGEETEEGAALEAGGSQGPAGDTVGKGEKTEVQRSAGCRGGLRGWLERKWGQKGEVRSAGLHPSKGWFIYSKNHLWPPACAWLALGMGQGSEQDKRVSFCHSRRIDRHCRNKQASCMSGAGKAGISECNERRSRVYVQSMSTLGRKDRKRSGHEVGKAAGALLVGEGRIGNQGSGRPRLERVCGARQERDVGGCECSSSLGKKMTWASVQREGCGVRADGGDQAGHLYSCPSKKCWRHRRGSNPGKEARKI